MLVEFEKKYWIKEFDSMKEKFGINVDITNIEDKSYIEVDELFGIIDNLYSELDIKNEEIEDLKRLLEEK